MRKRQNSGPRGPMVATIALLLIGPAALADVVSLVPIKDNTLFEDPTGSLSNGAGQHMFAGRSSITTNSSRRAVIAFDVAAAIPAGATIDSAALTLNMSMAPFGASAQSFDLHRLLADWGEGTSDAAFQEGGGAAATPGDATWLHTFHATQLWSNVGGDFAATISASRSIADAVGAYTWGPTDQMRADVQAWLDNPSTNFGWLLRGNEVQLQTARRFDSRDNPIASVRPVLQISFSVSSAGAGRVPDGDRVPGAPLTASRSSGGQITLNWGDSCTVTDEDYEVYEGLVGAFASHSSIFCTTAGAKTMTFTPTGGNRYYLVVPRNATHEGSYGRDSDGVERPGGLSACLSQSIAACP